MTNFNELPKVEQETLFGHIESHFDHDLVYNIKVELKDGKICAKCFEDKDKCSCDEG